MYILLEICTNQTLNELIKRRKRLTEMEVQYYLAQIVSSLIYLHQNKVIHREYISYIIQFKTGKPVPELKHGNQIRRFRTGHQIGVQRLKEKNYLRDSQLYRSLNLGREGTFIRGRYLVCWSHNVISFLNIVIHNLLVSHHLRLLK